MAVVLYRKKQTGTAQQSFYAYVEQVIVGGKSYFDAKHPSYEIAGAHGFTQLGFYCGVGTLHAAAYRDNPGMARAVERCAGLKGIGTNSSLAFLYYIMVNRNPEIAERMVSTLGSPGGVSMDDPFFRLRLFLVGQPNRRSYDPLLVFALAIKAANAAHEGRMVKMLSWKQQGENPEEFPRLAITPGA